MIGQNTWSYPAYTPLLWERGELYISRLAPGKDCIHLEWMPCGETAVYIGKVGENHFSLAGSTTGCEYDIIGLDTDTDYAIYVACGEKKSLVRLARTGETVGTVVNYLHPDDRYYAFSGNYLCSPSLLRLPDGGLLASMDLFGSNTPQNLTLIFRSDDDGQTWHHLSELMPCFWGKLFLHKGDVYMLGCSTEYGDLLIGRSTDGGKTFGAPVTLLRGSNGKSGHCGVHKNPQPVFRHKGRIYESLEWGAWANQEFCHAAMVMSCDENADLLQPESWHFTPPRKFDHFVPELASLPKTTQTIEGTLVLSPEGELLNIMRFGMHGKVLAYLVNTEDPDAPLTFHSLIDMPTTTTKFAIKHDAVTGYYYSIICRIHPGEGNQRRNLLSFVKSADLRSWELVCDLIDYSHCDGDTHGFQYVDFEMEGEDILWLCRTAMNNPHNYHDSNYTTFHRIQNFRHL